MNSLAGRQRDLVNVFTLMADAEDGLEKEE